MIAGILSAIRSRVSGQQGVEHSWDLWHAEREMPPAPSPMDLDKLQEELDRSGEQWTPDGRLVVTLELEPDLVEALDKLVALHGLADRYQALQKGVELLKFLSTASTYNRTGGRKVTVRPF